MSTTETIEGGGRPDVTSLDTRPIAVEMEALGYKPIWLARDTFVVDTNGSVAGFQATVTPCTNWVASRAAKHKDIARILLANAGVSVAQGAVFNRDEIEAALQYADSLNAPVVIKPANGRKGRQVTVGVTPGREFERAFLDVVDYGHRVLIERQFTDAREARFLVVGDECVAVYGKTPPMVVGDGTQTIKDLINAKNRERANNPHLRARLIKLTAHRICELNRQGYAPDDIPPRGQRIILDLNANVAAGGDSFDLTDNVHPSYKEVAVSAAAAVCGLDPAGVDILAHDFAKAATPRSYIVCEINNRPALGAHHFPAQGNARNAGVAIAHHTHQELSGRCLRKRKDKISMPRQASDLPLIANDGGFEKYYERNAQLIAVEWMRRGVDVCWLNNQFFVAKPHGVLLGYWGSGTSLTCSSGVAVTCRKDFIRRLLKRAKLSVARGRIFRRARGARSRASGLEFARSLGTVVVKPLHKGGTRSATRAVRDATQFERAWVRALGRTRREVLVEEYIEGISALFLVVGERCVAVQRRANWIDMTEFVHPSLKNIAVKAMRAIPGLDMACVDIIVRHFNREAKPGSYVIVDVDSKPSIWRFQHPGGGVSRNIAGEIVEYHLSQCAQSQEPSRNADLLTAAAIENNLRRKSAENT